MRHTPLRKLGDFTAEHLTWLSLCGLVAVITGFTPEEWIGHLAEKLRVSGVVNGHWPQFLDIRAVLVAVGVGVIVTDVLLKRRVASRPLSTAPATRRVDPTPADDATETAPPRESTPASLNIVADTLRFKVDWTDPPYTTLTLHVDQPLFEHYPGQWFRRDEAQRNCPELYQFLLGCPGMVSV